MTEETISDAALLQEFAAGKMSAFDTLVSRYRQVLFGWLVSSTGSHADAEDLFQEIWMRVMRHAERFTDTSFRAWMWTIARNLVIDYRRKRRPTLSLDATSGEDDLPLVDRLEGSNRNPGEDLELYDLNRQIFEAVQKLPEMQREVFLMRTQADMTFKEIATALDIPLNTALGRMHDALKKLRVFLRRELDHE